MRNRKQTPDPITDAQIMTANAEGMNACDDGAATADNPYAARILREAWLEGWCAADDRKRNSAEGR